MENLKLLILKGNTVLISEVREVSAGIGEPDCKLVNPVKVDGDKLERWPQYTDQTELIIHSDSILTIVNPNSKYIELYLKTIK